MIDFKSMECYLKNEKQRFVYHKNKITYEELNKLKELMKKYNKNKVKECFEPIIENGIKWKIELKCKGCNEIYEKEVSKSLLYEYLEDKIIWNKEKILCCEKCYNKIKKEREKIEIQEEANKRIMNEQYKKTYIELWLNKENELVDDYKKRLYDIKCDINNFLRFFTGKEIKSICDNMQYKDYLQTPYWKATSELAKRKAKYKCQLCNNNDKLNVHHRNYDNKGKEINNLNDLIVLCEKCHQKFHNIIE